MVTKDLADYCTDRMASTMGFVSDDGMPMKHLNKDTCGVCGETNIGCDENGVPEKQVLKPTMEDFLNFNSSIRCRAATRFMITAYAAGSLSERSKFVLFAKKKLI